jgi:hypothetical protein
MTSEVKIVLPGTLAIETHWMKRRARRLRSQDVTRSHLRPSRVPVPNAFTNDIAGNRIGQGGAEPRILPVRLPRRWHPRESQRGD